MDPDVYFAAFQLSRYNNKTYKVDDIAWDHCPVNTFKRGDTLISFNDYFRNVGVQHSCAQRAAL